MDVMKTIRFRTIALAGVALVGLVTGAAAQERANVLTSIEVKRLVSSAQSDDHARLRDHFTALADQYVTQARRDTDMARTLGGNPNRRFGVGTGNKYNRLAKAATESAATVRELAAHHGRLATGVPSTAPKDSARFEAGEGAPAPTTEQLREFAAGARTPADHRSLEEYYATLAETHAKAADKHVAMGRTYRASGIRSLDPAIHCDRMVKQSREAADEARSAAAEHRQLAQIG